MVALHDDRAGDLAINPALELRPDVDQDSAVLCGVEGLLRMETCEPGTRSGEKEVQATIAADAVHNSPASHRHSIDFGNDLLHQPTERPFVKRNQDPWPDKSPEKRHRPRDRDVLSR